uniref:Hypothetical chloroplast RF66 n=1 Tax=Ptisana novoguineensis TaxID=2764333 RepID=A0A7G7YHZ1_9MONI|nr:hypothetical chloroplast RF66 [Ptisana novoguineensis]QNH94111.1 hypothetical chloroplast RF66 [Ptisana novoguineensis]
MIHMELGPSTIVGMGLIMIGIPLYVLRKREPKVSRYYDFFFSSIGLLCGGILIFQGWRLDPILLLSQILLSGTTIFFIAENIILREKKIDKINLLSKRNNKTLLDNNRLLNFLRKDLIYKEMMLDEEKTCPRGWKKISYTISISYGDRTKDSFNIQKRKKMNG